MFGVVKFCIVYCRVHPSLEKVKVLSQTYTVHLTFVLLLLGQVLRSDPDPKGR